MDELGDAWDGRQVHARMHSWVNDAPLGHPDTAADTAASVPELIAQAVRTRPLGAGTVLGTGTVSNRDPEAGTACLAETRIRETLDNGSPSTPFLRAGDRLTIDLRRDGPHALIAGTTGAGKSELLQTIVASLAVANRPDAMTFVLVDYKGGSAFKDCVHLPHTVGMVTDLDAHLTERALESLTAELTRREHHAVVT